jgi:hypothetical protein
MLGFLECLDLALPIDDKAESNTLDAPGTEARNACLARESRRDLIADEPVGASPGLLRVNEIRVELTRRFDRGADHAFGDGVECDARVSAEIQNLL